MSIEREYAGTGQSIRLLLDLTGYIDVSMEANKQATIASETETTPSIIVVIPNQPTH